MLEVSTDLNNIMNYNSNWNPKLGCRNLLEQVRGIHWGLCFLMSKFNCFFTLVYFFPTGSNKMKYRSIFCQNTPTKDKTMTHGVCDLPWTIRKEGLGLPVWGRSALNSVPGAASLGWRQHQPWEDLGKKEGKNCNFCTKGPSIA